MNKYRFSFRCFRQFIIACKYTFIFAWYSLNNLCFASPCKNSQIRSNQLSLDHLQIWPLLIFISIAFSRFTVEGLPTVLRLQKYHHFCQVSSKSAKLRKIFSNTLPLLNSQPLPIGLVLYAFAVQGHITANVVASWTSGSHLLAGEWGRGSNCWHQSFTLGSAFQQPLRPCPCHARRWPRRPVPSPPPQWSPCVQPEFLLVSVVRTEEPYGKRAGCSHS